MRHVVYNRSLGPIQSVWDTTLHTMVRWGMQVEVMTRSTGCWCDTPYYKYGYCEQSCTSNHCTTASDMYINDIEDSNSIKSSPDYWRRASSPCIIPKSFQFLVRVVLPVSEYPRIRQWGCGTWNRLAPIKICVSLSWWEDSGSIFSEQVPHRSMVSDRQLLKCHLIRRMKLESVRPCFVWVVVDWAFTITNINKKARWANHQRYTSLTTPSI